jgi:Holliday junction resolvase
MASGVFERELKGILVGDPRILKKVTHTCNTDEKRLYSKISEKPFIVIRAAGSFGVDLVAIRGDVAFPIEVKSSTSDTLRFSRSERLRAQAEELIGLCRRSNLIPVYAYRLKNTRGDAWRIFTVETEKVDGILGLVYRRLPKVEKTKEGNIVLRWKKGMPLSKFIDYLCR